MDHEVLVIFGTLAVVVPIVVPVYLVYRYFVLRMNRTNSKEMEVILERIQTIEQRCTKLEEKVVDLHMLLDDERRELDKKLEKKLDQLLPHSPSVEQSTTTTSPDTSVQKSAPQRVR